MIELTHGNIIEADVEALVNSVNTVGVMGKGLALQFKKAYPDMFNAYVQACREGELVPGKVHVFERPGIVNPRYIINFPTKQHWRQPARIEFIRAGLASLIDEVRNRKIRSIAIPALGSGEGGLDWQVVESVIREALQQLPDVQVLLYPPQDAPSAEHIVHRNERPVMTLSRAKVLAVLDRYCVLGYELTLLEVQKLLYFLQTAGEPLKLQFAKRHYGPYADNLRHVLHRFEGHFTQGFADGRNSPRTEIHIFPNAIDQAYSVLNENREGNLQSDERLERVFRLIEGFESPYGMELLATVHWVVTKSLTPTTDVETVIQAVQAWNDRKRRVLRPEHIRIAWRRLQEQGWLEHSATTSPTS